MFYFYTVYTYGIEDMNQIKYNLYMITYESLWKTMKKRHISQYALIKHYGIGPAQITRLKRNESVTVGTIDKLCQILHCKVGDIMEYIPSDD